MLELYPDSVATYWHNFNVANAASMGATLGDVAASIGPHLAFLREHHDLLPPPADAAQLVDGAPAPALSPRLAEMMVAAQRLWCDGWLGAAAALEDEAAADGRGGRSRSAGGKLLRAAALITVAEWMLPPGTERHRAFERMRSAVLEGHRLRGDSPEPVGIDYAGHRLEGLFVRGAGSGRRPAVVMFNGYHASMDWYLLTGAARELAARGVSCLLFDHPGSGAARYRLGLALTPEIEHAGAAALEFLARRDDVDPARIGALGSSFGGYYAVRAAALERRFAACFAWGGWYCWPPEETFERGEPDGALVGAIEQSTVAELFWVFGVADQRSLYERIVSFTLEGVCARLKVPLFIVHGARDLQVPLWHAQKVVHQAVNAPLRELVVIDRQHGGDQHCHLDNLPGPLGLLCDRVAEILGADPRCR